ncbi:hypothetical protein CC117_10660 [Parafrankia colletiae]|uniref:RNA-binding protein containing a PIN domain n=1 Tax=Parafrankia colletiae TaxID=573497 RepID=A0A1S1RED3_9ACTN|nr:hypothetical protein CC117_10660 [Parafrankia colletiae]
MHPTGADYGLTWVVDAANVIGARPDGWWRDRAGAARRLHRDILTLLHRADGPRTQADRPAQVLLVLEGAARAGVPAGPGSPKFAPPRHGSGDISAGQREDQLPAPASEPNAPLPGKGTEPPHLLVIHAPASGDDAIVDAVRGTTSPTLVVTSDRALRDRVRALGAQVTSARWLRDLLDET